MIKNSQWITVPEQYASGDVCPVFRRRFAVKDPGSVKDAQLTITALGVYEARLNGKRISDYVLAPGWTSYEHRLQFQTYEVSALLEAENELTVTVGRGWFRSPMPGAVMTEEIRRRCAQPCGVIAELIISDNDGCENTIQTDTAWEVSESPVRFSEIYAGETVDARFVPDLWMPAAALEWSKDILIPQEGEEIRETERVLPREIIQTPAGETVVDFGQVITGYVEIHLSASAGDEVCFLHGEVLDEEGNFFNANYRSARARVMYICRGGEQTWHPQLTFFGFRYIKLLSWPGDPVPDNFSALVVHSDMRRIGRLESGLPILNQLFSNIVWSQRGNFLDIPTDCPQRDERLGWTGDAQIFVKAASYFYDVERFFRKWLHDLAADQRATGEVGQVIPDIIKTAPGSAGWGDAAVICPWQIYQAYGDPAVLREQFDSMCAWVDFIGKATETPNLWTGHFHFGDWLALDAPEGSYKGASRDDLIASAYYAWSTGLLVRAGQVIGRDVSRYRELHADVVNAYKAAFPDCRTQTEAVVALAFDLTDDPERVAADLSERIRRNGVAIQTGFIGTPYLLHVLSRYGYDELAWSLLLRTEYPSWLYPVTKGATTVWEHWDGIRPDGSFWNGRSNSFNHYAYGAVADWVFEVAAGIRHEWQHPGFEELVYEPHPDRHVGSLRAELETRYGRITAQWMYKDETIRYELETPVNTRVCLPGRHFHVKPGHYTFWDR